MNESQKIRYLISIICILGAVLLSITYYRLSNLTPHDTTTKLLLDLIPELVATALIIPIVFFLFERFGIYFNSTKKHEPDFSLQEKLQVLEEERMILELQATEILKMRETAGLTMERNTSGITLQNNNKELFSEMEKKVASLRAVLQMSEDNQTAEEKTRAQIAVGLGYMAKGQWENAIMVFDRYTSRETKEWEWHLYRASAYAVIPPYLVVDKSRDYAAAAADFCLGVIPPKAILGLS